jgi:hypothetical protein
MLTLEFKKTTGSGSGSSPCSVCPLDLSTARLWQGQLYIVQVIQFISEIIQDSNRKSGCFKHPKKCRQIWNFFLEKFIARTIGSFSRLEPVNLENMSKKEKKYTEGELRID